MNRREFLKATALIGAAGVAVPPLRAAPPLSARGPRATVALIRNTGLPQIAEADQAAAIRRLVDVAVCQTVGQRRPEDAWGSLFRPTETVAIKLNCLDPNLSPSPHVVDAVVAGLRSAGVPPEKVIVYDKENRDLIGAGYDIRFTGPGYRCYGTVGDDRCPGYEERFVTLGEDTTVRLSKIVTKQADAIVNVPVVKDHCWAGMTGALKNHFGTIHNPEDFHKIDGCNPAVADVCTHPNIRGKQRLVVVDALRIMYEGGPSGSPDILDYHGVLAATDPVALDAELALLVDISRKYKGLKSLQEVGRPPKYIQTAARYGLGVGDTKFIALRQFDLARSR